MFFKDYPYISSADVPPSPSSLTAEQPCRRQVSAIGNVPATSRSRADKHGNCVAFRLLEAMSSGCNVMLIR
ncbi:hypothetical protein KIN20_014379 [Parelaphostrongylus tenuis]|uniref:Uncharacterized protein n=1 Tax=Parelaphostrongylus tenuis TaxID=148309 RepID=A0AAD5MDK2_PARTN|nr:hypothetical protein KIN20_014379 [Parelaphostrongylus tenuis]